MRPSLAVKRGHGFTMGRKVVVAVEHAWVMKQTQSDLFSKS